MKMVSKKTLTGILLTILVLIIIGGIYFISSQKKVKLPQKEEIKKEKTTGETLEQLTPKESKPLNEEEKKKIEEVLKNLTPENPKPKTPEEINKENELLKQLTPK
jgi:cell division protein FtsN